MPYGCALFSMLRFRKLQVEGVQRYDWGVCLTLAHDAATYLSLQRDSTPDFPFVPVSSTHNLLFLDDMYGATPAQVNAKLYGVVVFVNLADTAEGRSDMVRCSKLCYAPRILTRLANGQCPLFVDTAGVALLRSRGLEYCVESVPVGFTFQAISTNNIKDFVECCICLNYKAQYKWKSCHHDNAEHGALICNECFNKLRRYQLRDRRRAACSARDVVSPCPLCRNVSSVVKVRGRAR